MALTLALALKSLMSVKAGAPAPLHRPYPWDRVTLRIGTSNFKTRVHITSIMKFPQSSPLFGSSNHGGNNGIVRLLRASTDFKTEVTRITKRGAWRHRHKKIASSSPFITVGYKAQK